jgi:hypothetical protein
MQEEMSEGIGGYVDATVLFRRSSQKRHSDLLHTTKREHTTSHSRSTIHIAVATYEMAVQGVELFLIAHFSCCRAT